MNEVQKLAVNVCAAAYLEDSDFLNADGEFARVLKKASPEIGPELADDLVSAHCHAVYKAAAAAAKARISGRWLPGDRPLGTPAA